MKAMLCTTTGEWKEINIELSEESKNELEALKKKLGLDKIEHLKIRC